jgi:hypothetical protein
MASATANRNLCDACGKARGISRCEGCEKIFCYNHFGDHRQQLNQQLDEVEVSRDLFRQTLTEQTKNPQKHSLMRQIDRWERNSIKMVQETANEAREMLLIHTTGHLTKIEAKLNELTTQLRRSREENDFMETDLCHWKEQLTQFTNELVKPSNVVLKQYSTAFVSKIYVDALTGRPAYFSYFYGK